MPCPTHENGGIINAGFLILCFRHQLRQAQPTLGRRDQALAEILSYHVIFCCNNLPYMA